jgi:hypothetical protein
MLCPRDVLAVVRALRLPEGWGFSCLGSAERPLLAIYVPEDGLLAVEINCVREGRVYGMDVVVDEEAAPAELAAALASAADRLRAMVERDHPWPN